MKGPVEPYVDPRAPVQIISGSAGCLEDHNIVVPIMAWFIAAYDYKTYGYGKLHVMNSTHLHWEQIAVWDKKGYLNEPVVLDSLYIVRNTHGPYGN